MIKIAHLSSAHPRYDTRIFVKMCSSSVAAGYDTSLVIADGNGNESLNGISIIDVGNKSGNRISRMTKIVFKVYKAALELRADIYHIHDPELLFIALLLKKRGKKVIFDAHEDLPIQILSKPYLSKYFAKPISIFAVHYERFFCKRIDAVVSATSFIANKFSKVNQVSINVNNYPKIDEFTSISTDNFLKRKSCCYIGGITKVRGIYEIVNAMSLVDQNVTMILAGNFSEEKVKKDIVQLDGWKSVNEMGWVNRKGISNVLKDSFAGLVTLHPIENYIDALPVKMFEYMASGIPVISSNIDLWQGIVETEDCGICVDPYSVSQIADAINYLSENIDVAFKMGQNGRNAVIKKYNWDVEKIKLINLYEMLSK